MCKSILSALAAVGLGLALAAPAPAQWINPSGYPAYGLDIYGNPYGTTYGTRVYGPGYTYSYPYMYQSNNQAFPQRYDYTYYGYGPWFASPYGSYGRYSWRR
jgi:hypothetical protein